MKNNHPPVMGPNGKRKKINFSSLKRLLKMLYGYYPVLLPIIIACIIFAAITASVPAIFQQQVLAGIQKWITEEYIEAPVYSYSEVRLDMIPKAITKYIFTPPAKYVK